MITQKGVPDGIRASRPSKVAGRGHSYGERLLIIQDKKDPNDPLTAMRNRMVEEQTERVRRETNGTFGKNPVAIPGNAHSDEFIKEVCALFSTMSGREVSKKYGKSPSWHYHIKNLGKRKGFI